MDTNPDPLNIWRQDLNARPIISDPHVPPASTLMGVADRLKAVANVLVTLDNDDAEERHFGIEIAGMAVSFTSKVLDHLGLGTDDLTTSFLNIKMASLAINNLLAAANGHLEEWKRAAPIQPETTVEMVIGQDQPAEPAEADADQQTESGLNVDLDTFTVTYKGKDCFFGNVLAFWLLERLNWSPGHYIHLDTLKSDVWHDEDTRDKAVQRQISTIRSLLRKAEIDGIVIDGRVKSHYRLTLR
jgi:DNA-binding response OmpR family regulator